MHQDLINLREKSSSVHGRHKSSMKPQGPRALISPASEIERTNAGVLAHLKFDNSARALHPRGPLVIRFTGRNSLSPHHRATCYEHSQPFGNSARPSYPERNFRWNQLLDSSIGLSPLCQADTMDLHVTTATGFHPSFLGLHPRQA